MKQNVLEHIIVNDILIFTQLRITRPIIFKLIKIYKDHCFHLLTLSVLKFSIEHKTHVLDPKAFFKKRC